MSLSRRIKRFFSRKLKKLQIRQRVKTLAQSDAEKVTFEHDHSVYEIKLIHKAVNFTENIVTKTYQIIQKF
jgi:hypothetical protein